MRLFSILIILIISQNILSQQSNLSSTVNSITEYIASTHFLEIRKNNGDLASVDSIYIKALEINNNDYSETLLTLMVATVPYREVPIKLPLFNVIVNYPLISAEEDIFTKKNENLPRFFFIDTPENDYGDLDKLAHFFGSAFLSYESNIFDLGKLIGYFVEAFEESFKVQSSIDLRDLDVNEYGRFFGKLLKKDQNLLPSQIFLIRSTRYIRIIL
ncbi:MAG: hypothetical protein HXY49_04590 [Ignavibacteriaceae bacterium]|nr:hypothetical protein [Ignavibacteriaceae bacterium]